MHSQPVTIEIDRYRADPSSPEWELPPWGHPISQGVFPLLITIEERLFPVGTAFTIGRGVTFVVSAAHCIREAWKYEERLANLLVSRELPRSIELKSAGIAVLHNRPNGHGGIDISIWPLENITGAPPTDVVFGFPEFQNHFATLVNRISFDLPTIGERIWSVGYAQFKFPPDGIPVADIRKGNFDWHREYGHKLMVVEGFVDRIFTQRFMAGFVEGPCFTFTAETAHAQSGGPVLSCDGIVRGVNSAGGTLYFDRPMSIASLLCPLLSIPLRFGVTIGPMRMNAVRSLVDLIGQGMIPTDGSEERVGIGTAGSEGIFPVYPQADETMSEYIHDDFSSFQSGRKATVQKRPVFRLRRVDRQT